MFEFTKNCELFSIEQKIGKSGNPYTMLTLLAENGKTVDIMYTGQPLNYHKLELRKAYDFKFVLTLGRYTKVNIVDVVY